MLWLWPKQDVLAIAFLLWPKPKHKTKTPCIGSGVLAITKTWNQNTLLWFRCFGLNQNVETKTLPLSWFSPGENQSTRKRCWFVLVFPLGNQNIWMAFRFAVVFRRSDFGDSDALVRTKRPKTKTCLRWFWVLWFEPNHSEPTHFALVSNALAITKASMKMRWLWP